MSRQRAAFVLGWGLLVLATLALTPAPEAPSLAPREASDVAAFRAIVGRISVGESYYAAYGGELRPRGYPTRSVFNWRTPLLISVLARVPTLVARAGLASLGLLLFLLTFRQTAHEPLWTAASNVMQAGTLILALTSGAEVLGEAWAGILIGLSAYAFARRKTGAAVALGLLGLLVRELAAPYCVACAVLALARRRWREVAAWASGAGLYAVYYAWHVVQVHAHQLPTDSSHQSSWLTAAGTRSLLMVADWHAWLLPCPPWVTVLAMTVVAAAVAAARTPLHARAASAVYMLFFMLAGQSFNGYWGFVAWPTWALAFGYGTEDLVEAGRTLSSSSRATQWLGRR